MSAGIPTDTETETRHIVLSAHFTGQAATENSTPINQVVAWGGQYYDSDIFQLGPLIV